jgi:hypothetical protein
LVAKEPEMDQGPAMIQLEYRVDAANAERFLGLMQAYRQMRRRDGAFYWELFHDMGDPSRFVDQRVRRLQLQSAKGGRVSPLLMPHQDAGPAKTRTPPPGPQARPPEADASLTSDPTKVPAAAQPACELFISLGLVLFSRRRREGDRAQARRMGLKGKESSAPPSHDSQEARPRGKRSEAIVSVYR